jgi:drug/metabolite transporter (DMT)-like permease
VVHIMLRASELVWVILLSSIHKQERPSKIEAVCCACIAAGTAITAVNSHSEDVSAAALTINLTSAVFGALHVVALRWASLTLHGKGPCLSRRVQCLTHGLIASFLSFFLQLTLSFCWMMKPNVGCGGMMSMCRASSNEKACQAIKSPRTRFVWYVHTASPVQAKL